MRVQHLVFFFSFFRNDVQTCKREFPHSVGPEAGEDDMHRGCSTPRLTMCESLLPTVCDARSKFMKIESIFKLLMSRPTC